MRIYYIVSQFSSCTVHTNKTLSNITLMAYKRRIEYYRFKKKSLIVTYNVFNFHIDVSMNLSMPCSTSFNETRDYSIIVHNITRSKTEQLCQCLFFYASETVRHFCTVFSVRAWKFWRLILCACMKARIDDYLIIYPPCIRVVVGRRASKIKLNFVLVVRGEGCWLNQLVILFLYFGKSLIKIVATNTQTNCFTSARRWTCFL